MTLSWETISFFGGGNNFLSKIEKAQLIREKFNKPNYIKIQNQFYRTFLEWLRLCASNAGGARVWSLVRELRSHMLSYAAKKKKKKNPTN